MFFAFFMTSLLFAAEPSCLLLTPGGSGGGKDE